MEYIIGLLTLSPITAVIIGFISMYKIKKGKVKIEYNFWSVGLLLLFIWSVFVSIYNKSLLSLGGSLLLLIYFYVTQFSKTLVNDKILFNKALDITIKFTTITAIIGIAEKIIFSILGYSEHRIFSTYGNPNMTGSWFATIICVTVYMIGKNTDKRKLYITSIALMSITLLLTGSRGSYIALSLTAITIVTIKGLKIKKRIIFTTTIIAIIALCIATFAELDLISKYILAHPFKDSISPRIKIWKDAILLIKSKPIIGWGLLATYEKGKEILPHYKQASIHAHNIWLTMWSCLGIVGLYIYSYMKIRLFSSMAKLYKKDKDLTLLFLSINLIVVIQGIVDVSLFAPQLGIVFCITGGMITEMTKEKTLSKNKNINYYQEIAV